MRKGLSALALIGVLSLVACQQGQKVDLTPLEDKVNTLEQQVKQLQDQVTQIQAAPVTTPGEEVNLAPVQAKLTKLEKDVRTLKGQVADLNKKISELKKAVDLLIQKRG